jgi:hypothetical protein
MIEKTNITSETGTVRMIITAVTGWKKIQGVHRFSAGSGEQ